MWLTVRILSDSTVCDESTSCSSLKINVVLIALVLNFTHESQRSQVGAHAFRCVWSDDSDHARCGGVKMRIDMKGNGTMCIATVLQHDLNYPGIFLTGLLQFLFSAFLCTWPSSLFRTW